MGSCPSFQDVQPDIAGLQEAWGTTETAQAHQLAELLGMHAALRPDQVRVQVGVAVLCRWPILTVHQYRLSLRHRPEIVALAAVLDHPRRPLARGGLLPGLGARARRPAH
jgi:endonuclease/exonuclease/phosphatase family metal-dependent hydrolase